MAFDRANEVNGRMKDAEGMPNDTEDLSREGKRDDATSMVQAVVDPNRWYYHHVSTP